jgi:hypothetical protein
MAEITHGPVLPTVEHPWLVLELWFIQLLFLLSLLVEL